jgi:peptide chain release factor 3
VTETAEDTGTTGRPAGPEASGHVATEVSRRRTFAVIAHPDAGKSTLTEALALHARVITEAGAVHGKSGRRSTVSDWMDMEKARGISPRTRTSSTSSTPPVTPTSPRTPTASSPRSTRR